MLNRSKGARGLAAWIIAITTLLGATPGLRAQVSDDVIAIEAGRVITLAGDDIVGGTVLIEAGRVKAVGKGIDVPWNAKVFKFPRGVVLPGLIACHSTIGLRVPNENMSNVPYISVLDGIDPSSAAIRNSLRDGIAIAHVIPANATRLGGQGAVVRLTGKTVADMVLVSPSAMKISLRAPPGETRMQSAAALRKTFLDLFFHVRGVIREGEPPVEISGRPEAEPTLTSVVEGKAPWQDIAWEKLTMEKVAPEWLPMVDVVRGKLPVFIYCATPSDVFRAFEVIDANQLKATLVLPRDAYKLAGVLKARKDLGPVVLDDDLVTWETDPETGAEERHVTPRILYDAGIRFALQTAEDGRDRGPAFSREGETHLWYQAALLVRHGVPRVEALKSITTTPARILGLEHRLGTIESGKDGTVTVFSGDPLDARSWVEQVFIEGRLVYRKDQDRDLELLLKDPEAKF